MIYCLTALGTSGLTPYSELLLVDRPIKFLVALGLLSFG
jgi:hypothetical protein